MNIAGFEKIIQFLSRPTMLIGFAGWLLIMLYKELVKSGVLPQVTQKKGGKLLTWFIQYGAWLFILLMMF